MYLEYNVPVAVDSFILMTITIIHPSNILIFCDVRWVEPRICQSVGLLSLPNSINLPLLADDFFCILLKLFQLQNTAC